MKTTINIFTDYAGLKKQARVLSLPPVVTITRDYFETLRPLNGQSIKLDIDTIYFDRWGCSDLQAIIPDFARVENSNDGFYLTQLEVMTNLRDAVYQCSLCGTQSTNPPPGSFCLECITRPDLTRETLYKLYLRPVSTLDIDLSISRLVIPKWLIERFEKMPTLHKPQDATIYQILNV